MSKLLKQALENEERTIAEIDHAMVSLFGRNSRKLRTFRELADQFKKEMERLGAVDSFHLPIFAISGASGVGKTWLAKQFTSDSEIRSKLHEDEPTLKITGFGPKTPPVLSETSGEIGTYHRCESEKMLTGLETEYVVLDLPSNDDLSDKVREIANLALDSSHIKIFVFGSSTLRSGEQIEKLSKASGASILPVYSKCNPENNHRQQDHYNKLKEKYPETNFLDALYVDDWSPDSQSEGEVADETKKKLRGILSKAISDQKVKHSLATQIQCKSHHFKNELDLSIIQDFRTKVKKSADDLDSAFKELPNAIALKLIGDDRTLRAGIRTRLRTAYVDETHSALFPFRSLLQILSLFSGAWDRLAFASLGSVPSFVLSIVQATKNAKDAKKVKNSIKKHAENRLKESIRPKLNKFSDAIASYSKESELITPRNPKPEVELTGINDLSASVEKLFATRVNEGLPKMHFLLSLPAILAFWGLAIGPIWETYNRYGQAWMESLFSATDIDIFKYPVLSFSTISSTLLHCLMPPTIIAGIALVLLCRKSSTDNIASTIRKDYDSKVDEMIKDEALAMHINDKRLEASRILLKDRSSQ